MASTAQTGAGIKKNAAKAAPPTGASKISASAKSAPATKAPAQASPARSARPATTAATTTKSRRINPDQRRNYIEVAAYYIAERRGFVGGDATSDWAAAEVEIDRLLDEGKLNG